VDLLNFLQSLVRTQSRRRIESRSQLFEQPLAMADLFQHPNVPSHTMSWGYFGAFNLLDEFADLVY
jgi:hypothetical protein